ncbi:hypothetical protein [Variovorax sp.]|jgi:hypothetical protein|uniref:hypothetical protein n=1 Tax=Variovorax sp. TaxID=1871043 RepID=UPI0037D99232
MSFDMGNQQLWHLSYVATLWRRYIPVPAVSKTVEPARTAWTEMGLKVMESRSLVCDGNLGRWVCSLIVQPLGADGVIASAEVTLDGKLRCRLSTIVPHARGGVEVEVTAFEQRCVDWIEEADSQPRPAWC